MSKKKNIYLSEIVRFTSYLDSLSKDNLKKLQSEEYSIIFDIVLKDDKPSANKKHLSIDVEVVIGELNKMSSREDGDQYLLSKNLKKSDFEALAKKLDVPFQKNDKIEKIKDKVIEGTIGFRLRSQAIQNS